MLPRQQQRLQRRLKPMDGVRNRWCDKKKKPLIVQSHEDKMLLSQSMHQRPQFFTAFHVDKIDGRQLFPIDNHEFTFFVDCCLSEQAIRLQSGLSMVLTYPTTHTASHVANDQKECHAVFPCLVLEEDQKIGRGQNGRFCRGSSF